MKNSHLLLQQLEQTAKLLSHIFYFSAKLPVYSAFIKLCERAAICLIFIKANNNNRLKAIVRNNSVRYENVCYCCIIAIAF